MTDTDLPPELTDEKAMHEYAEHMALLVVDVMAVRAREQRQVDSPASNAGIPQEHET